MPPPLSPGQQQFVGCYWQAVIGLVIVALVIILVGAVGAAFQGAMP